MRRESSRNRFSFECARPPGSRWAILLLAFAAAAGCSTPLTPPPEPIDLSPLERVQTGIDRTIGLSAAFSDYDAIAIGGVQQANGTIRRDGVVDLVRKTYDSELDPSLTWSITVIVTLFDTPARADRDLDSSCSSLARSGVSGRLVRWQKGLQCVSSTEHLHNDPTYHLPTDLYSSWLFVRRDRIVARLYERHIGSPKSAKNAIIAELAERLGRLVPARSAN